MTYDDLLEIAWSAFTGAKKSVKRTSDGDRSPIAAAHDALCTIVARELNARPPGVALLQQTRRELIGEINRLTLESLLQARAALLRLMDAGCLLEMGPSNQPVAGRKSVKIIPLAETQFGDMDLAMLEISAAFWNFKPELHAAITAFRQIDCLAWDYEEYTKTIAGNRAAAPVLQENRKVVARVSSRRNYLAKQVGPQVQKVWEELKKRFTIPYYAGGPTLRPVGTKLKNPDLVEISKWYVHHGQGMVQPLPLAKSVSDRMRRQWQRDWALYEAHGIAIAYLGVWVRNVGPEEVSRRCKICYRHVSKKNSQYCEKHKQKANERLPQRDIHVGVISKALARKIERKHRLDRLSNIEVYSHRIDHYGLTEEFERLNLPEVLEDSAVAMGTFVMNLQGLMGLRLGGRAWHHLCNMVEFAAREWHAAEDLTGKSGRVQEFEQERIKNWFSLNTFFATWFGIKKQKLVTGHEFKSLGHDPGHPVTKGLSPAYSEIKADLIHFRAWDDVSAKFDAYAYLDVGKVKRMRERGLGSKRKLMSFDDIGGKLGISGEAARKAYYRASRDNWKPRADRRKRVLSEGIEMLKAHLWAVNT